MRKAIGLIVWADAETAAPLLVLKANGAAMIRLPSGIRVWIAAGHVNMRRGMQGLVLLVQENLKHDPHAGDLYIF